MRFFGKESENFQSWKAFSSLQKQSSQKWEGAKYAGGSRPSFFFGFIRINKIKLVRQGKLLCKPRTKSALPTGLPRAYAFAKITILLNFSLFVPKNFLNGPLLFFEFT